MVFKTPNSSFYRVLRYLLHDYLSVIDLVCSGWLLGFCYVVARVLLGAHLVLSPSDESVVTDDLLKERKSLEFFFGRIKPQCPGISASMLTHHSLLYSDHQHT